MRNKLFSYIIVLGLVSSCQEDVMPDSPYDLTGQEVVIGRSGDGRTLIGLLAENKRGEEIVIFHMKDECFVNGYEVRVSFTKDFRATQLVQFNIQNVNNTFNGNRCNNHMWDIITLRARDVIMKEGNVIKNIIIGSNIEGWTEILPYDNLAFQTLLNSKN